MVKKIIGLSLVLFIGNSYAADWGFYQEHDGVKQYFDRSSLKVDSETDTVSFWEKRTGNLGSSNGVKISSLVSLDKFYCNENSYQILEMHSYDAKGKVIVSLTTPFPIVNIVPDSLSENMFLAACEDSKL